MQWSKNLLVFAAPAAAGVLTQGPAALRASAAMALFICISSGTYFFNDAIDVEADRAHPRKRLRPMAAGTLSIRAGFATAAVLVGVALGLSALVAPQLSLLLGVYVALQIAYALRLKHMPVYDLACVTGGFVLRAIAGGVATGVPVSEWFLLVATFGSMLMVAGKRVAEQQELGTAAGDHRPTLEIYSSTFLRIVLGIAAGGAILSYGQWALQVQLALRHHADPIWYQLSMVPMVLALLRFTFSVERGGGARPEDMVVSDPSLGVLAIVWAALFVLGVYAS
jgi:decaprenyl-phosphate phosphoribosyltransferase